LLQVGNILDYLKAHHVEDELDGFTFRQQLVGVPEDVDGIEVDNSVHHTADTLDGSGGIPHLLSHQVDGQNDDVKHQGLHDAAEEFAQVEMLIFHAYACQKAEDAVEQEDEEDHKYNVFERSEIPDKDTENGDEKVFNSVKHSLP
jgi:hypothetical protein